MEKKHKDLEEQFETMKRGIIEAAAKKAESSNIDDVRKRMILKF